MTTEQIQETEQLAHAHFSASGSNLWLNCSGGFKLNWLHNKKYGPEPDSEFSGPGKRAHIIGARCLLEGLKAESLIGEIVDGEAVDAEMAEYVQEYIDYVRIYAKDEPTLVERRVDYSHLVPNGFGTLDAAVFCSITGICHIFDGKFGKGIKVSAVGNNQLRLYALGIYKEFGLEYHISSFKLHSVQPPMKNFSSWDISVSDLFAFGEYASKQADLAMTDDAPITPGILQCQWCRVKGSCNALAKQAEASVHVDFDTLVNFTQPDINELSYERKKAILDNMSDMTSFFKNVEKSVFTEVLNGGEFPGRKLVLGKSTRAFTKEGIEKLTELLGKEAFNEKLIGLGEAEKKLGKTTVDGLTEKPEGKPTLVLESDKRPSIQYSPFKK